jgi:predicted N-acyltransferase
MNRHHRFQIFPANNWQSSHRHPQNRGRFFPKLQGKANLRPKKGKRFLKNFIALAMRIKEKQKVLDWVYTLWIK